MKFSIGYAQEKITPDMNRPVYLAGFDRNRHAKKIHDDLWVRVTAMKSNRTSCRVLAACDLIGLTAGTCDAIRKIVNQEVPRAQIVISSTHTHHGPDTIGLWGQDEKTSGVDPEYQNWLIETVAQTTLNALESLHPVAVRSAAVPVEHVIRNMRDPQIIENELVVCQFGDPDTKNPEVTWVNFACHPETLWKDNQLITSDYPGFLRDALERNIGGKAVFFPGALGGMQTPDVLRHSFTEAQTIGERLAQAAQRAIDEVPWKDDPDFNMTTLDFTIPADNPLLIAAMQSGLAYGPKYRDGIVITRASLIQLDDTWLACVPGELLPLLGLQIKQKLTKAGARIGGVIGLADDELGYILPEEAYRYPENPLAPGSHYEETMSVGPKAGPSVLSALDKLVSEA